MFELDREVAAWSAAVHDRACRTSARKSELEDHLYCEIERARAQGLSEEQAFRVAVSRLGSVSSLAAEHAKNRTLLATTCAVVSRRERGAPAGELRGPLLAHAMVWASVILGAALILSKSTMPDAMSGGILALLVPLWWASELVLRRALAAPPPGGSR